MPLSLAVAVVASGAGALDRGTGHRAAAARACAELGRFVACRGFSAAGGFTGPRFGVDVGFIAGFDRETGVVPERFVVLGEAVKQPVGSVALEVQQRRLEGALRPQVEGHEHLLIEAEDGVEARCDVAMNLDPVSTDQGLEKLTGSLVGVQPGLPLDLGLTLVVVLLLGLVEIEVAPAVRAFA